MKRFIFVLIAALVLTNLLAAPFAYAQKAPAKKPPATKKAIRPLTEAQKKEIFNTLALAQKRAKDEAKRRYPIPDPSRPGYDRAFADKQIDRQMDLANELDEKYRKEVDRKFKRKYGLTHDQISTIAFDGVKKGWPFPISQ